MQGLKLNKLESSVVYLVENTPGMLTRTKLVKLLYLADLLSVKKNNGKLTEARYRSYHYGPFSEDIINAIKKLSGFEILELSGMANSGLFYSYYPGDTPRYGSLNLSDEDKAVLDEIVSGYGNKQLQQILSEVYETPQYKRTQFGQPIAVE